MNKDIQLKGGKNKASVFKLLDLKKIFSKNSVVDIFKDIKQDESECLPQGVKVFNKYKMAL